MNRISRYAGIVLAGLLALGAVNAAPAQADTTAPSLGVSTPAPATITTTSDGWILYPSVLDRIALSGTSKDRARSQTVKGKIEGGICTLQMSGTASTTAQLHLEESAYQPSTCQFRVTTTPLSASETAALATIGSTSGSISVSSSSRAAAPDAGPRVVGAPAATSLAVTAASSYTGHVQGQWWDPINIKIAHQTVNMGWNYYASPYTWWSNTYGFAAWLPTPPGVWIYDETYYKSGSSSRSGANFSANANMQNDSFLYWVLYTFGPTGWTACGFPSRPRANFYLNESITAVGSSFNYSVSDSKSGACTNLVHHDQNIGGGYA